MGTPDFSVPCLEALIENGYEVALVVTQADKPKGRGHKLMPPPVKDCALRHNIPVFQPGRMKDDETYETLKKVNAEVKKILLFILVLINTVNLLSTRMSLIFETPNKSFKFVRICKNKGYKHKNC